MLYIESFGNPRRFARIARRVSGSKPIVAVKSGRSAAGVRASASHTGALLSASDVTVDALFRQAGVIRTDSMQELFDVGGLLCSQPLPAGTRVAVVTNAGGPGIMCADACQAAGLDVVELPPHVRARLARFLAPEASLANPIDMIATATAESYRRTIKTLVAEDCCDAIVAIFVPPLITRAEDVAREIRTAALDANGVAIATVFMNSEGAPPVEEGEVPVPSFGFPEDAARALGHVAGERQVPHSHPVERGYSSAIARIVCSSGSLSRMLCRASRSDACSRWESSSSSLTAVCVIFICWGVRVTVSMP
jgi:acyl-CoA synthetase (NDP forming)